LFIKEIIPAAVFKSGKYIASLTQGVLTAQSSPIAIALVYLTAKATVYWDRLRNYTKEMNMPKD
jgi:hypothetical protein